VHLPDVLVAALRHRAEITPAGLLPTSDGVVHRRRLVPGERLSLGSDLWFQILGQHEPGELLLGSALGAPEGLALVADPASTVPPQEDSEFPGIRSSVWSLANAARHGLSKNGPCRRISGNCWDSCWDEGYSTGPRVKKCL